MPFRLRLKAIANVVLDKSNKLTCAATDATTLTPIPDDQRVLKHIACVHGRTTEHGAPAATETDAISDDVHRALRRLARALGRLAAREHLSSQTDQTNDNGLDQPKSGDRTEDPS